MLETFTPEHGGRGQGYQGPTRPASILWTSTGQVSLRQEWLLGVNPKDRQRQTGKFRRGRPERFFDLQGYGALLRRPWGLGSGEGAQEASPVKRDEHHPRLGRRFPLAEWLVLPMD